MGKLKRWALAISLAANQLINAISGGDLGETVSSRAQRARAHGSAFGAGVCHVLEAVDFHEEIKGEDHCDKAARHYHERRSDGRGSLPSRSVRW